MTVAELTQTMGLDELRHWIARERIDPIPDFWFAWRWLCALVSRANPQYKPMKPEDFDFNKPQSNSIEASRAAFAAMAAFSKQKAKPKELNARK